MISRNEASTGEPKAASQAETIGRRLSDVADRAENVGHRLGDLLARLRGQVPQAVEDNKAVPAGYGGAIGNLGATTERLGKTVSLCTEALDEIERLI